MNQKHALSLSSAASLSDPLPYQRLIGKLIYLTVTRSDLAYPVHIVSQFMQKPTDDHWHAALRVLRFVKQALGQGILFSATSDLNLRVYCDADWAACPLTRRSVTGYYVTLGHSIISWKVKKQQVVARSSAESEYRLMAKASCEVVWLTRLLTTWASTFRGLFPFIAIIKRPSILRAIQSSMNVQNT